MSFSPSDGFMVHFFFFYFSVYSKFVPHIAFVMREKIIHAALKS